MLMVRSSGAGGCGLFPWSICKELRKASVNNELNEELTECVAVTNVMDKLLRRKCSWVAGYGEETVVVVVIVGLVVVDPHHHHCCWKGPGFPFVAVGWHHADKRFHGLAQRPAVDLALEVVHSLGPAPSHEFKVVRSRAEGVRFIR
ncbi:hypothetical protein FRX31_020097 [Thalictrum thalictroides]|uniref:Uncharacterized protein n=1 Tax=Thalictrum thalictroides TaxID=46969 RepID=A0A7J6W042_THATH|nr:hypothetical protein FRX31_020097 [Thalictrum thalictroides]